MLRVIDYVAFYNGKWAHSNLGYQTPLDYDREFNKNVA